MNTMTATTVEMLRTNSSVEGFNSVFAEAVAIDNRIEVNIRLADAINPDRLCELTADSKRLNERLQSLAWELRGEFVAAGIRVASQWGTDGNWAIFLSPHSIGDCRTPEFLITSRLTFTS